MGRSTDGGEGGHEWTGGRVENTMQRTGNIRMPGRERGWDGPGLNGKRTLVGQRHGKASGWSKDRVSTGGTIARRRTKPGILDLDVLRTCAARKLTVMRCFQWSRLRDSAREKVKQNHKV